MQTRPKLMCFNLYSRLFLLYFALEKFDSNLTLDMNINGDIQIEEDEVFHYSVDPRSIYGVLLGI